MNPLHGQNNVQGGGDMGAIPDRLTGFQHGSAGWCETEGTVTNSERRVQRVRRAVPPPEGVRDDIEVIYEIARRMGHDWGAPDAECIWNELRCLSPMHAGMSYSRLEESGGLQWPCYDESHPGEMFLHGRLWQDPLLGPRAPFHPVEFEPPVDQLDEEFPIRLTTGRRLDSYNTGVQTAGYNSPLRRAEALDLAPEDGAHYSVREGERVLVSSRRGSVVAPVHLDPALRPGLPLGALSRPGSHQRSHHRCRGPQIRNLRI